MKHINIRELALKFKTNLYIARIKEEVKNRRILKGYNIGELFTRRTTESKSLFARLANFN